MKTSMFLLTACLTLLPLATLADLPSPPDAWTEFADVAEAADAGWYVTCGLSQQLLIDADCVCGLCSVGCRNTAAYWSKRFGLAVSAPLTGFQALRFQHRTTWTGFDQLPWNLFLAMETTAAELAAGWDLKQLHWTYEKAEVWTETTLDLAAAEWQWRSTESGMWSTDATGGTTELTQLAQIEWYLNIPFGLATGERKLIDDLALVGTGTAVPGGTPRTSLIRAIYPNPANPRVTVAVSIPVEGHATVEVLDVRGQRVDLIHDGWLPAGQQQLVWDGRGPDGRAHPTGVYLVRVLTPRSHDRGAVTLVR